MFGARNPNITIRILFLRIDVDIYVAGCAVPNIANIAFADAQGLVLHLKIRERR
jgi:hypothetical protein